MAKKQTKSQNPSPENEATELRPRNINNDLSMFIDAVGTLFGEEKAERILGVSLMVTLLQSAGHPKDAQRILDKRCDVRMAHHYLSDIVELQIVARRV